MSTIKGPFDFTGSIGNFRCYDDPATGKRILSGKGGYTQAQFNNLESLEPNRKNASEFGESSIWASLLYDSLTDLKHLMHPRCYNKITSKGKFIVRQDFTNDLGSRKLEVSKQPQALTEIDFNERIPFRRVIKDCFTIDFLEDKRTLTLRIPDFVTVRDAWWTTKYLAFRIYLVVAQVSDMVWNPDNQKWEPVVAGLEVLSKKVVSCWMYCNSQSNEVNLSVLLDDPAFALPGTVVLAAVGAEFALSSIDGQPVALPHNGSMAIVKCFTA